MRRALSPLDGSRMAEKALPLAQELAAEWRAPIDLVLVVPRARVDAERGPMGEHLTRMAGSLSGQVKTHVLVDDPADELTGFARGGGITDIVMSTHGRTGLARVFVGSVAYEMIHRLPVHVIVIPTLAATRSGQSDETDAREVTTSVDS